MDGSAGKCSELWGDLEAKGDVEVLKVRLVLHRAVWHHCREMQRDAWWRWGPVFYHVMPAECQSRGMLEDLSKCH